MANNVGDIRQQVLENSEELQDFLRDLKGWEKDMKRKDLELRNKPKEPKKLPSIRKPFSKPTNELNVSSDLNSKTVPSDVTDKEVLEKESNSSPKEQRISSYDYSAWDKFDVDNALKEVESNAAEKNEEVQDESDSTSSDDDDDDEQEEIRVQMLKQKALLEKDKGNRFFSEGKYDDAIACYTSGIQADPTNAVLPANRAMALLKKGQLGGAEKDCTLSISLDCTYAKAFHRRGTCRFALKKYQLARQDFLKVIELEPGNKFARVELDKLELEFRKNDKSQLDSKPAISNTPSTVTTAEEEKETISPKAEESPRLSEKASTTLSECNRKKSFFDDLPDQIKPIYKPSHLRSKQPLEKLIVEVTSSDEEDVELVIPLVQRPSTLPYTKPGSTANSSAIQTPSTPIFTPSTPQAPQTAFQFETDWRRLRNWPDLRLKYLTQVPPESLPGMYQQSMETEIFIGILHSLKEVSKNDKEAAYLYLKHLTEVGRFHTIVMFMAPEDTQIVKEVLEAISSVKTPQEINTLNSLYGL